MMLVWGGVGGCGNMLLSEWTAEMIITTLLGKGHS